MEMTTSGPSDGDYASICVYNNMVFINSLLTLFPPFLLSSFLRLQFRSLFIFSLQFRTTKSKFQLDRRSAFFF